MHLCYIDESGTPQIPGNTTHYVLAGLCIPVDKWKKCESDVQEIKSKYKLDKNEVHTAWILRPYFEQSKIPNFDKLDFTKRKYEVQKLRNAELIRLNNHLTKEQFRNTKKNYKKTDAYIHLTHDERKKFIYELATLVGNWSFCRLFSECIDKLHFNPSITKYTVDEQAFDQVITRFEHYLKIYTKSSRVTQFGILIHDNNDTVKLKHTQLMKKFHSNGTLWTSIKNIVETPFYVDSQLTSMVQIADLCSYGLRRYLEKDETDLFNQLYKIADKKDRKVVGIRHFAPNSCNCTICVNHR